MTAADPSTGPRRRLAVLGVLLAATVAATVWPPSPDPADAAVDLVAPRKPLLPAAQAPEVPPPATGPVSTPHGVAARAPIDEEAGSTLFGAEPAPAPPPSPPVRTVAAAPAPPPAPPPTPATPRGVLRDGDQIRALLETADGRVLALQAGDGFDGEWRLDAVDAVTVVLVHLPTRARHALPLPPPLDPPAPARP